MRFSHELRYDASPAQVHAMLADPAFREQVTAAQDALRTDVRIDGSGAGMSVVVDQTQPAAGIPSFATKFVGEEIRIVQRETWRDEVGADLRVEIPGKPGALDGGIDLRADGAGTVETVAGELKVRIPVVGGRLEDLIAGLLRKALRAEERTGRAWLAERP